MARPRFRQSRMHKVTRRTSGNLTLNSTNWANVDTGLDITLDAQVGDDIEVGINALAGTEAQILFLDVVSLVSAAPVNSFGKQGAVTTAPAPNGIAGWRGAASMETVLGSPVHKTLVAGDISSGKVTLRLRYSVPGNKTLYADGTNWTLEFWAKNLGPADPH